MAEFTERQREQVRTGDAKQNALLRRELLTERAAIKEFCGNMPRKEAERQALEEMVLG